MAQYTQQKQGWLFASEGTDYVDHPSDPGGATRYGVTRKTLAAWRGISPWTSLPKSEVRNLSHDEAAQIMKVQYWDRVYGDRLPEGLDYAMWDYAVNSGVSKAVKDLQRCLGSRYDGRIDGVMGELTLAAVNATNDVVSLIVALCERRFAFVKSLSTFKTFGRGWTRRIMGDRIGSQPGNDIGVIDRAAMLTLGSPNIPAPVPPRRPEDHGKAEPENDSLVEALKKPEGLSILGGALGTILTAIANQPILQVGILIALGLGLFFFVRRMRKADPA